MTDGGEALRELAARIGIVDEYWDQTGRERRFTSDDTRRALLAAMGIDASTDASAMHALAELRTETERELIAPVRVVEIADAACSSLAVRTPASAPDGGRWRLEVETEVGERHVAEGHWHAGGALELSLPPDTPLGYHRVRIALDCGTEERVGEQTLIVVPSRCVSPDDVLDDRSAFGVIANLYTVRSRANWGIGDFTDLSVLAEWTGSIGGDFVGVNPLHALLNRNGDVSPYSPVTRLFRNPIYIDVTRVPELEYAPEVQSRLASPEVAAELDALRDAPGVRYEQVMAVKGIALDALHSVFLDRVRGTGEPRDRAYDAYLAEHEPALTRFATWMAIAEYRRMFDWREWPEEFRSPSGEAAQQFVETHAARIDFHRWIQFEADRQLHAAAAVARDRGMRIGLYQDLAIGSSPSGADTWAFADLFARGASVGAPPDPYAATGQNWGLPPIDPRALRRSGYRYFIALIRAGFRHAGALRIDHVMGLFRLFWIPDGKTGMEGAYVRYPSQDLLGIIALESVRHNALVVGEDLGTVPDDVPPSLQKWGVLSSRVLYFEREHDGRFKSAVSYPALSLTTANTHDLASIAGFWSERDIALRRDVGLITSDDDEARARSERAHERGALIQLLVDEGVLRDGRTPQSSAELRAAVHGFLWSTPARLVGLSLDDLAGEVDPVNVPGVGPDRYTSWTRKMRADLQSITSSDEADVVLAAIR